MEDVYESLHWITLIKVHIHSNKDRWELHDNNLNKDWWKYIIT